MNKFRDILFWECTYNWDNNILVSVRVYLDNFYLRIVKIVLSVLWQSPRTISRVNKFTMFKRFRCNLVITNIKFEDIWWDSVRRVTCTIIKISIWIYYLTLRKATLNNPNYLGMYRVSISQFHSVLVWDKHRNLWHEICYCKIQPSIIMKQHSRDCIKFWSGGDHHSSLKHLEVNIYNITIMLWT